MGRGGGGDRGNVMGGYRVGAITSEIVRLLKIWRRNSNLTGGHATQTKRIKYPCAIKEKIGDPASEKIQVFSLSCHRTLCKWFVARKLLSLKMYYKHKRPRKYTKGTKYGKQA